MGRYVVITSHHHHRGGSSHSFLVNGSIGFEWYQNPYPRYANFTIRCLVIGPIVGLLLGIILDGFIRDNHFRKIVLEIATTVLVFFVVVYVLFLSSTMIQVRE